MNVAMAAVGARVLEAIGNGPVSVEKLQSGVSAIPGPVEGKAALLAAIHNAHYFQGYELASYWCERALRFWPKSAEIMKRFVDFQTRRSDTMACKSAIDLFGSRELTTLIRGGRKRLDISLIDAMVTCLASAGIDIRSQVSDLRAAEHSLKGGSKELTDFYYSSTLLRPAELAWTSKSFSTNRASHCIYASAFWEQSKFVFLGERGRPVGLRLTYRVPDAAQTGDMIRVEVNGHQLAQAPAEARWRTLEIVISSDFVTDGQNEVVITWPDAGERSEVLLDRAADALLARRVPHFYRVFGEIHSLLAFDPSAVSLAEEAHAASSETMMAASSEVSGLVAAD